MTKELLNRLKHDLKDAQKQLENLNKYEEQLKNKLEINLTEKRKTQLLIDSCRSKLRMTRRKRTMQRKRIKRKKMRIRRTQRDNKII